MKHTHDIVYPTARLTITYGLDDNGHPIITEQWDNPTNPNGDVDMITKAGLLTMAQQTLTAESLGYFDEKREP